MLPIVQCVALRVDSSENSGGLSGMVGSPHVAASGVGLESARRQFRNSANLAPPFILNIVPLSADGKQKERKLY